MKRQRLCPIPSGSAVLLAAFCSLAAFSPQAQAQTWLFDFGDALATTGQPETWININSGIGSMTTNGGQVSNLASTTGATTDVDFLMIERFAGANQDGTQSFPGFPGSATRDSLFGNTELFGTLQNIFPKFKLASLDPALSYDFTFYASRLSVSDNRETLYTVTGESVAAVTLNIANNISNTVMLTGVVPNEFGEIQVGLSPGANNNNGNHFTYLGVMRVTAVPEPASALFLLAGAGFLAGRRHRRAE